MNNQVDPELMTKEVLEKAMACETPEALVALAKEKCVELTLEEAKDYLQKIEGLDIELSDEQMEKVAGGYVVWDCPFHR